MSKMTVVAFLSKRGGNRWSGKVKENVKLPEDLWLNLFENEGKNKEGKKETYYTLGFYNDDDDDDEYSSKPSKSRARDDDDDDEDDGEDDDIPF